jgi:hypothetical protein
MRRRDPQAAENGFQMLLPHAGEHVEELIAEFVAEHNDHGLQCWLLELIGEACSPLALPIFIDQLNGEDEVLRCWAVRGLQALGSPEAGMALWQARCNGVPIDP